MPNSWVCMNLESLSDFGRKKEFTILMVAVLVSMLKRMKPYQNRVSESCLGLAKEAQVSRSTVIRAVRLFEEWGVMKKISRPHAASEWQINPSCFCKRLTKKELGGG